MVKAKKRFNPSDAEEEQGTTLGANLTPVRLDELPTSLRGMLKEMIGIDIGDVAEIKSPHDELSEALEMVTAEYPDIIDSSTNKLGELLATELFPKNKVIRATATPKLKAGEDKSLFDVFLHYKWITKPESKRLLTKMELLQKGKDEKLKSSEVRSRSLSFAVIFGATFRGTERATAFQNHIEYRILKLVAKKFGMPEFKAVNDFDAIYGCKETIQAIADHSEDLVDVLNRIPDTSTKEHQTRSLIAFIYKLFQKVEEMCEGDLDSLSDEQYDLLILSSYILLCTFEDSFEYCYLMQAFPVKTNLATWKVISEYRAESPMLPYFFDEKGQLTELAKMTRALARTYLDKWRPDYANDETLYSSKVAADTLPALGRFLSRIGEHKHVFDKLNTEELAGRFKACFVRIEAFEQVLVDVESTLGSIDPTLGERTEKIKQNVQTYSSLSQDMLSKNHVAIDKNTRLILKIFSKSILNEFLSRLNVVTRIKDDLQNLLSNGDFGAVADLAQRAKEGTDIAHQAMEEIVSGLTNKMTPLDLSTPKPKAKQYSQGEIDALTETHASELSDKTSKIEDLEAQVAQLTQANGKLESESVRMEQEKTIIESKHSALVKRTQGEGSGYSESLDRVLFGKPTVTDIFNVINDAYPYVIYADNFDKLAEKCVYGAPKKLHTAVKRLVDDYFNQITAGNPDSVAKTIIDSYYAANESETTMSSPRLRAMREFTFSGKKILMEKHLTIGGDRDRTKCVQIYFDIIDGKLHVGYIGEHLEVSGS